MNVLDFSKHSSGMETRKRTYKLRRPGSKFGRMMMRLLSNVDFGKLLGRISGEPLPNRISIQVRFKDFVVKAIRPKPIRKLWEVPQKTNTLYEFCPDERIRTHRLLGKPALGLSPPQLIQANQQYQLNFKKAYT